MKDATDYIEVLDCDLALEGELREAYENNGPVCSIIAEFREEHSRNSDIHLDGQTLRFCVRVLRRRAATFKQSKRAYVRNTLNDAADELIGFDEMFGDKA